MERELETLFAQKQLRLTTPRKAVFRILHETKEPLSAPSIAAKCQSIDRTSVYRTIKIFGQLGIIKSVQIGWRQRYELADPFKSHHHHLSCSSCGQLIDLHSTKIERIVSTIASEHNFKATDHSFEIRGLCKNCRG